jgi:hypothetical protein
LPNYRHSAHQCLHIYQQDGKVEVALRQSGLTAKQGTKLLHELRQDMAKLGLRLARVMLNGELFWQVPQRDHPRVTTNTPIDKIY